jgi:glycosyltransferase 2 family protein
MRNLPSISLPSGRVRVILSLLLAALALYLILRDLDYQAVWTTLIQADVGLVLLALASIATNVAGKTIRWKVLMGRAGQQVALSRALSGLLIGQMVNTLLPMRAGDVTRAYVVGGLGPGRAFTLGTIVLEKVIDMLCYTALFFCSCSACPSRPGSASKPTPSPPSRLASSS